MTASHPLTRFALRTLTALILATPGLRAQDSSAALPAALLRRVAEAVDGDRTGLPRYVAVTVRAPYEVLESFTNRLDAVAFSRAHTGTTVVGPYYAAPDSGQVTAMYRLTACYHDGVRSLWICDGDTTRVNAVPLEQVRAVIITVVAADSSLTRTTRYEPAHADAFFFTQSAIDKFVLPYYLWVHGAQYAADLRQRSLQRFSGPPR